MKSSFIKIVCLLVLVSACTLYKKDSSKEGQKIKDYFHIAVFDRTTDSLANMSGIGPNAWKTTIINNPNVILYLGKVVLHEDNTIEFLPTETDNNNEKYVTLFSSRITNSKDKGLLGIQGDYNIYHEGDSYFWTLVRIRMDDQPTYIISNQTGDDFFAKKKIKGEEELLKGFTNYNKDKEFHNSIIFSERKYGKTSY